MGKFIIYHHGDTDGKAAGAGVYNLIDINGYTRKECKCMYNYDIPFDFTGVEEDDIIFIVDYSLTNKSNISKLAGLCKDLWKGQEHRHIFWFDHHKTSFDHMNEYPLNKITSIVDTSVCGAMITYLVGIQMYNSSEHTVDKLISCINNVSVILRRGDYERFCTNEYILYTDSWDTWKLNKPNSKEFNIGTMSTKSLQDPKNDIWKEIFRDEYFCKDFVKSLMEKADTVAEYLDTVNDQFITEMGYEFKLNGYNCIMYNGRGNSTTFGDLINRYDICAMFYFNGETYIYSLYSKNIDTSLISKRMGGGGHPGASGFQNKDLLFRKGTSIEL